ncbi:MAG: hypothetical protein WA160_07275 [Pseudobdellovibrio sp.]
MPRTKAKDGDYNNKTRSKLENTPFKSAAEMNEKSEEIQMEVWRRLEYARLFQKMTENENYEFVRQELQQGLTCGYGEDTDGYLVRVFSEGIGVKISINKDLVKDTEKSEGFVEALIRSTADSFSKSYYQIKGMLPVEAAEFQNLPKKAKVK